MTSESRDDPDVLQVRGVHKRFAGVHALRGIDLSIRPGQICHLMGENGCGKSTLIKIISGAQPPDEGSLVVAGQHHDALTPLQALAAGIETVYQDLSLLPNLPVADNVALTAQLVGHAGGLLHRVDADRLAATARRALAAVDLPTDAGFLATPVERLPIATRQLVAIARAIASKARLVIMDEPTTALTRREVENLFRVVQTLREQRTSVLFVSHKLDECYRLGGQVVVLRDGQVVADGPIERFTKRELGHLMTGRTLDDARYRPVTVDAPALLSVRGLARSGRFQPVSFDLGRGEVLGITGLLDSGRNALARALAGIDPADQGECLLDGRPVPLRSAGDAIAARIAYVPEDRLGEGLFLERSIRDNLITAVLPRLRTALGWLDGGRARELAAHSIDALQVATPDTTRPVKSLSGGNQQRVLIGRWLAIGPRVLILHGPTVGVDVGSKDTIYRIVHRLAGDGMGVILVSDDIPELLQNCDRIAVMRGGELAAVHRADATDEHRIYQDMLAEAAPHPHAAGRAGTEAA